MTNFEPGSKEYIEARKQERADAKWQTIADVDWADLEHFVGNCRRNQDRESFDAAIRILQALKKQVLER
jgi:hypothetical protein